MLIANIAIVCTICKPLLSPFWKPSLVGRTCATTSDTRNRLRCRHPLLAHTHTGCTELSNANEWRMPMPVVYSVSGILKLVCLEFVEIFAHRTTLSTNSDASDSRSADSWVGAGIYPIRPRPPRWKESSQPSETASSSSSTNPDEVTSNSLVYLRFCARRGQGISRWTR